VAKKMQRKGIREMRRQPRCNLLECLGEANNPGVVPAARSDEMIE